MVYIDTNMVRAGVVSHPSMWPFCEYNEIQHPRKRNVLINYDMLQGLFGNFKKKAGIYNKEMRHISSGRVLLSMRLILRPKRAIQVSKTPTFEI